MAPDPLFNTPAFGPLLDACPDPLLVVLDGVVVAANAASHDLLTGEGLVGTDVATWFDAPSEPALRQHLTERSRPSAFVVVRTRGGAVPSVSLRFHASPVGGDSRAVLVTLHTPPVANNTAFFEMASRTASDILASQTGVEALSSFAEAACRLVGARYGAIGVASADAQSLDEFITVGLTADAERKIGARPSGAGVLGLLLRRDRPLRISRLSEHAASSGFPPNHPPMEAFLGVPIRHDTTVLGSLYLTEKEGGFTQEDEVTIDALSIHLAVAIRNLHLLKRQRSLVAGLITAQEEERRAVAYDLHDGLTQFVMGAYAHLQSSRASEAAGQSDDAAEEFTIGLQYLNEAVVESRRLVNGLRTLALDDMGLAGALEQLVFEERARAGWAEARLEHDLADARFNQTLQTAVYRIGQEALTNIRKHAKAQKVHLRLATEAGTRDSLGTLTLTVEDDGVGFDRSLIPLHGDRVGLHGMAERARLLDGAFQITSSPGTGTRLQVRLPIYPPANPVTKDTPDD